MDCLDEAFAAAGAPRRIYEPLIAALERTDLEPLRERAQADAAARGLDFGSGEPMRVDPVPRLIGAREWRDLEPGLLQRARALNEFVLDAYGEQRIIAAGVLPRRVIETSPGFEPAMRGLLDPEVPPATVIGFDLLRDAGGSLVALEDNARMPSGACYALALREVVEPLLGLGEAPRPIDGYAKALGAALRAASPRAGSGGPPAAILSDGPRNGAWFEHRELAGALGLPVVGPADLEPAGNRLLARVEGGRVPVEVLYRRLDEDRLSRPDGGPTPLGALLLPALRAGTLRCVNAFGTGVADDKLAHAYVPEMIEFYLGEAPLLPSVPTFDLGGDGAEAVERLEQLVVKPRDGFGGHGVTVMERAGRAERERVAAAVRREPDRFVAQEPVPLSTHPTVCDGRLRPRHVDLRPYVVCGGGGGTAMPGGLTRFAPGDGDMVVNSSRGGGCKDTWVMDR